MIESANSIAKIYDLIRWLMPIVSKFPKCKRYTLGQRIEDNLLDILNKRAYLGGHHVPILS
ncbi:MAG: hypothetical protein AABZ57_04305 [Candidatus Margulisiibacteriota bacterium]